jgi:hypothetical protein
MLYKSQIQYNKGRFVNIHLPTKLRDVFPGVPQPENTVDESAAVFRTYVIKNVMPANNWLLVTDAT